MSALPLKVTYLSSLPDFESLFDVIRRAQIASVRLTKKGQLLLLQTNGTFGQFDLTELRMGKWSEGWKQLIRGEVKTAAINESFPCALCTRANEILYISAQAGTVLTTPLSDLKVTRETFPSPILDIRFNIGNRLLLAISESTIQVLALSKRYELLSFTPFSPTCRKFVAENCVVFSKKYGNLFYYLDKMFDPHIQTYSLGVNPNVDYMIVKCIIDNREITESRAFNLLMDSELVTLDVGPDDAFVLVSRAKSVYLMRNEVVSSASIDQMAEVTLVRWHESGKLIMLCTATNQIYFYDLCLHPLRVVGSDDRGYIDLAADKLFGKCINVLSSEEHAVFIGQSSFVVSSILRHPNREFSLVGMHIKSGNTNEAMDCLEQIAAEREFTQHFLMITDHLHLTLDVKMIQRLAEIYKKYSPTRISETMGKHALVRLGYRLMNLGLYHDVFRVAVRAHSTKLINDLAFAANRAGFQGVALIAKVERGRMDENFLGWGEELEKIVQFTGKTMAGTDYRHLVHDVEEVLSARRLTDVQEKGGYIVEKNFWEINLEDYAKGLLYESEGKYTQALEVYTLHALTQDINRVQELIKQSDVAVSGSEVSIRLENSSDS